MLRGSQDVTAKMSLSILLGEIEPWLLAAAACGLALFIALLIRCKYSRRKRAKPEGETNAVPRPYVEPPSQKAVIEEVANDPAVSSKTTKEEPLTTYCSNGCQGACACPALDSHSSLTNNEPALKEPNIVIDPPPPEDTPPTDPLPEIPKPESQSSLRRRSSHKSALQNLKDRFVKRESLDAGSESNGSERRGSGSQGSERRGSESQGSKRRRSRFGKKMSISKSSENERRGSQVEGSGTGSGSEHRGFKLADWGRRGSSASNKQVNRTGSNKQVNQAGSNKQVNKEGSYKEVNNGGSRKQVNKAGSNKEVRKGGSKKQVNEGRSDKEVTKGGSNKQVNKGGGNKEVASIDKIKSEAVTPQHSRKDSLKLLKGIMSFKKTASRDGEESHMAEST